jgi:Pyridoxamine 5'-phosphate oxidase
VHEPRAENIANNYDNDALVSPADGALAWADGRDRLAAARLYWRATWGPGGRPHVRPVFGVMVEDVLYSTSSQAARKTANLAADPRCSLTTSTDEIDFIVEGTAAPVTDPATLDQIVEAYHAKYGWPVSVRSGTFHAPFGAPTAGPPPYQPYAIVPEVVYGLGLNEANALLSTRWRF